MSSLSLAVEADGVGFLQGLCGQQVDMVYLDPPFGHGAFGPVDEGWIVDLIAAAAAVRGRSGIVYLHCDPRLLWKLAAMRVGEPAGVIAWKNGWVSGFKSRSTKFWPRQYQLIAGWPGPEWAYRPVVDAARSGKPRRGTDTKTRTVFSDWWETPNPVDQCSFSKEKVGWPTQKPVALLERLIVGSTQPGGLIVDPCCGSGTSRVAAALTGRRWTGCDASGTAVEITNKRTVLNATKRGGEGAP